MDSNPKISSDQILNKSVSIIPDPNNLHENNSPYLADFIPKISSDEMLNKSIPIISDSQNPDSISNSILKNPVQQTHQIRVSQVNKPEHPLLLSHIPEERSCPKLVISNYLHVKNLTQEQVMN